MRFLPTDLPDVVIIDVEKREDHRGFFGRTWDPVEFRDHGLNPALAQINVGYSFRRGTLRGLHFQRAPHQEAKVVRCTKGAVFDVAVDLRPGSPTYHRWLGVELSMDAQRMLYVPEGFAHGYLTLTDDAEITYQTSEPYAPHAATGVRYDDPALSIDWPLPVEVVSDQDRSWPLLEGP